jgi:hypothetical protein
MAIEALCSERRKRERTGRPAGPGGAERLDIDIVL